MAAATISPAPRPAAMPGAPGPMALVDGARLPLAFIGFGLAAFAAAACWLTLETWRGIPSLHHPRIVGLAHLWLPGFLLSICLGASYQLLPVLLGSPLPVSATWRWIHLLLHTAGALSLVTGLATGNYVGAAIGGSAIAAGACGLLIVTVRTFRASRRRDAVALSLPLSAGWLAATTSAGLILAANRHHPFLPWSVLDLLKAHAHLGLGGYFLTLIQGVSFQLVPLFTLGQLQHPERVARGLLASQVGLAMLIPGLAWAQPGLRIAGAGLVIIGLAFSGSALVRTLAARRRQPVDASLRGYLAGLGLLATGAIGGLALLFPAATTHPGTTLAYALLLVTGGLTCTVLGMLGRILPFLVWMKCYGPRVGRGPVPLASNLAPPGLESTWWRLQLAAVAILTTAAALGSESGFAAGGALLLLATVLWLVHAARILRHLVNAGESGPLPVPTGASHPSP